MRKAFRQAAGYFIRVVDQVPENGWESVALGVWTIRDLVGHTSRSLTNVETYSVTPGTQIDNHTPVDYFRRAMESLAAPESVAERGRQAGQDLGPHPAETVRQISERVLDQVDQISDDFVLGLPVGGMRLIDYLPTRVFELVIHGLDLATAIGVTDEPPSDSLGVTMHLLADLALASGKAPHLALAVTGRSLLPEGFNLVG